MIDRDRMRDIAAQYAIELNDEQLAKLDIYERLMTEWNTHTNLTAITEPEEIEIKHFLDCMIAAKYCINGEKIADIGTGAGFPGVVIGIVKPDCKITLIDSLQKRLNFLDLLCKSLNMSCDIVHYRAEDAGHDKKLREAFDLTIARAVAPLNVLAEFCLPLTTVGGRMIAMKGRAADEELSIAEKALAQLGGKLRSIERYILPDTSGRSLIIVAKAEKTKECYPRKPAQIKVKPL